MSVGHDSAEPGPPSGAAHSAGPLTAAVATLCRELTPQVGPATAAGLGDVVRRLSAPLQVAVAGRLKSGKSTLVNALIGRRVAPTGVGECARLVTRFRYGTVDRIELVRMDGRAEVLPFDADGMIPAGLGRGAAAGDHAAGAGVSHLDAYLTSAVLRDVTVIDTPGLASADAASAARAERFLGVDSSASTSALSSASTTVMAARRTLRLPTCSIRCRPVPSPVPRHCSTW